MPAFFVYNDFYSFLPDENTFLHTIRSNSLKR